MSKIEIVWFRDLTRWDVKNYLHSLKSNFPLVKLGEYITENTHKIKPFEYPRQTFDILGVNNKEGVYFNETLLGSRIKQPYYVVNSGDIFYNPYRVNVGSIGIVPQEFDKKYTSPAYVVFKTNERELLSSYLVFILKSKWFNTHLRANTKGSVRQNLSFESLCDLSIPLPPLSVQQEIVSKIQSLKDKIKALQEEEERLKEEIENYLYTTLGLQKQEKRERKKIFIVRFKDLERWDTTYNQDRGIDFMSSQGVPLSSLREKAEASVVLATDTHLQIHNNECQETSKMDCHDLNSREFNSRNDVNDDIPKYPLVKLGEVCHTNIGLIYKPNNVSKNNKGIPVLRSNNIQNGKIDYNDLLYVENIRIPNNKIVKKGDLLICVRNGSIKLIGKTAMIEKDGMSFGAFMAIIRSEYNKFIYEVLQTDFFKKTIFERRTSGINQISQNDIKNFQIPLPPLNVQEEIVQFIETKRKIIENNNTLIKDLQNHLDKELESLILG